MPRILFVDDQRNDFLIWGEPLATDFGWKVEYAEDAATALDELEKHTFDIAIIDRWMPDGKDGPKRMVGDELLEQVMARWPYVCPIMLTNFGDLEAATRATRYGAYRYFVKGEVTHSELDRACRKGIQWQLARRIRQSLLGATSADDVVKQVKSWVKGLLEPGVYCFAYLEVEKSGGLIIADADTTSRNGPLAAALAKVSHSSNAFVSSLRLPRVDSFF
jgi:DNA-binding NtrC family response regulator